MIKFFRNRVLSWWFGIAMKYSRCHCVWLWWCFSCVWMMQCTHNWHLLMSHASADRGSSCSFTFLLVSCFGLAVIARDSCWASSCGPAWFSWPFCLKMWFVDILCIWRCGLWTYTVFEDVVYGHTLYLKMWFMDSVWRCGLWTMCLKMWFMDYVFEDVVYGHCI